ncbi:MAG: hypothetical protein RTV31_07105 [Candidatus Thorarchaeota archaeon]
MDNSDFYDKLVSVFEWYIPASKEKKEPKPGYYKLYKESLRNSHRMNDVQIKVLEDYALRMLRGPSRCKGDEVFYLCNILASIGAGSRSEELNTALNMNPYCPNPINAKAHMILTDILRAAGAFREDEEPIYHDLCEILVDNDVVRRQGFFILTNHRLFVVGGENYGFETSHRLSYGESWKTEHWLQAMDYVELEGINEAYYEKGDEIAYLKYKTEYLKTTTREFYGPLWIRFSLNNKHEIKHGEVLVSIRATRIGKGKSNMKIDAQRRMNILVETIDELWQSI